MNKAKLVIESVLPNGDCAVLIRFTASEHRLIAIHALTTDFLAKPMVITDNKIINVIPATDSLVLVFAQAVDLTDYLIHDVMRRIEHLDVTSASGNNHEIPVCYDPAVAADVTSVCEVLDLTIEQLIENHTAMVYQVDMLGFLPGFAYLSTNHQVLKLPRKATPNVQVPAGSVAITGQQTGIYALPSPGGWHVIGRTPVQLINWLNKQQPMRLNPLDQVRFKAIDLAQFKAFESSRITEVSGYD